jgi:hypothetical protein
MAISWTAGGVLMALMLAGCAGQGVSLNASPAAENALPGRWILAAPNAPTCGINFSGAAGARAGTVSPEGGCPGSFYLSRRWLLEQDALVINDDENNVLARFNFADGRYEGKSTAGTPVTLARQPAPAN